MTASFAKATLQTFATIAGGVLASERKRLGAEAFRQTFGEWLGKVIGTAFENERTEAAKQTLVIAGALWGMTMLSEEDALAHLRTGLALGRKEWERAQEAMANDAAAQALREARGR